MKKFLIISVGGSPEPIVSSINYHEPDFVCFLASDKSKDLVDKKTNKGEAIIKQVKPGLDYQVYVITDVDDIDVCFNEALAAYNSLEKTSDSKIIVDYTGGTKTMSVALVFLAILENLDLYFSTGRRENADKVVSGTERSELNTPWLLFWEIKLREVKKLFDEGLYFSAESSINDFAERFLIPEKKKAYKKLKAICSAFNAWDAFDHKKAKKILEDYRPEYKEQIFFLERILGERKDAIGYEKVVDLFYSAKRREKLFRYDDAVCLLYRALEMLAQLRLQLKYNLNSSDVDLYEINNLDLPEEIKKEAIEHCQKYRNDTDNKIKISLLAQYRLLEILGDSFGRVYSNHKDEFRDFTKFRNYSILAHGQQPVKGSDYKKFEIFAENFINSCFEELNVKLSDFEEIFKFKLFEI